MVIGTAEAIEYVGKLIEELDAPAELRNFVTRRLNYLRVDAAMSIIGDAITRGNGEQSSGGNAGGVTGNASTSPGAGGTTSSGRFGGTGGLGGGLGGGEPL